MILYTDTVCTLYTYRFEVCIWIRFYVDPSLLFIIYINDLPSVSNLFDMLIYADDTTLICNLDEVLDESTLNMELNNIHGWMSSNKLSLNIKKTKYMIFHTKQRHVIYLSLNINNVKIERVTEFNFLGLILMEKSYTIHFK